MKETEFYQIIKMCFYTYMFYLLKDFKYKCNIDVNAF